VKGTLATPGVLALVCPSSRFPCGDLWADEVSVVCTWCGRVRKMLAMMGLSIISGAVSTLGASFFLLMGTIVFFYKVSEVVLAHSACTASPSPSLRHRTSHDATAYCVGGRGLSLLHSSAPSFSSSFHSLWYVFHVPLLLVGSRVRVIVVHISTSPGLCGCNKRPGYIPGCIRCTHGLEGS